MFEQIIGQKKVKDMLIRSLKSNRLPHALLFTGEQGVGKEAMAIELAKALICQQNDYFACGQCNDCRRISQLSHPDVVYIFPAVTKASTEDLRNIIKSIVKNPYLRLKPWANPSISIDQIRELKRTAALSSFENKGRVVIIAEVEHMTIEASNSLLKILEEPPPQMTIILTSAQPNLLLPTIISRCQSLQFNPISWLDIETALRDRMDIAPEQALLVAKLSFGSYRRALELLEEELDQKRKKVIDMLRTIIRSDMDRLLMMEDLLRTEDKRSIKELLELLLMWFRDALVCVEGNSDEILIINIDQLETLHKFCNSFEKLDFNVIIDEIERAIHLFERNVYVNLILINLFYSLKRNLRRRKNV